MLRQGLLAGSIIIALVLAGCADVQKDPNRPAAEEGQDPPAAEENPVEEVLDLGEEDPVNWAPDAGGFPWPDGQGTNANGGNAGSGDGQQAQDGPNQAATGNGTEFQNSFVGDECSGPPADPEFANAIGAATGVHVRESIVGVDPVNLVQLGVTQAGPGQAQDSDEQPQLEVPDPTGTFSHAVKAQVVKAEANSLVSGEPRQSTQETVVELVNVSIMDGLVRADVLRSQGFTQATPHSAAWNTNGSLVQGLVVDGVAQESVRPWVTFDVSDTFGEGSTVALFETMGHIHTPIKPVDGFAADLKINMVHVYLRDVNRAVDGDQGLEVIISQLHSHSDFPEDPGCRPVQGVHGHAYNIHGTNQLPAQPATVGFLRIPRTGGMEERHLASIEVGPNNVEAAKTEIEGRLEPAADGEGNGSGDGRSWSRAMSEVLDACLLETADGCVVTATLVRVESFAEARPGFTQATGSTVIADLKVLGVDVCTEVDPDGYCRPEPNTKVDVPGGLATIVLNQQIPVETEMPDCHAGLKVRGIHITPTVENARVVVSEAEAAAFFCPNPALE